MADSIHSVRGMRDLMGAELELWHDIEEQVRRVFHTYGFEELKTPILEYEQLFRRGVGEGSDIVSKEMYSFLESESEGAQRVTMRPEGTAPAVRALLQSKAYQSLPVRWFYWSPMFRKERPQKGRYRQHHQVGFEIFGASGPGSDVEGLILIQDILSAFGISQITFRVNSLGNREDQAQYRQALTDYFRPLKNFLSEDSQKRLEKNPLRILDSKSQSDQELCQKAPLPIEFLSKPSAHHWKEFLRLCHLWNVPIQEDPRLVRGLDYYTHTVFEIVDSSGRLGAQNSLAGGGRYDKLLSDLGGPDIPAFGFGAGIERLLMARNPEADALLESDPRFDLGMIVPGERERDAIGPIVHRLRQRGLRVDWSCDSPQSFKALFKRADRMKVPFVWILGSDEYESGVLKTKDLRSGQEESHPLGQPFANFSDLDELTAKISSLLSLGGSPTNHKT